MSEPINVLREALKAPGLALTDGEQARVVAEFERGGDKYSRRLLRRLLEEKRVSASAFQLGAPTGALLNRRRRWPVTKENRRKRKGRKGRKGRGR